MVGGRHYGHYLRHFPQNFKACYGNFESKTGPRMENPKSKNQKSTYIWLGNVSFLSLEFAWFCQGFATSFFENFARVRFQRHFLRLFSQKFSGAFQSFLRFLGPLKSIIPRGWGSPTTSHRPCLYFCVHRLRLKISFHALGSEGMFPCELSWWADQPLPCLPLQPWVLLLPQPLWCSLGTARLSRQAGGGRYARVTICILLHNFALFVQ